MLADFLLRLMPMIVKEAGRQGRKWYQVIALSGWAGVHALGGSTPGRSASGAGEDVQRVAMHRGHGDAPTTAPRWCHVPRRLRLSPFSRAGPLIKRLGAAVGMSRARDKWGRARRASPTRRSFSSTRAGA